MRGYIDSEVARNDALFFMSHGGDDQIKILFVLTLYKVPGKVMGIAMGKVFPNINDHQEWILSHGIELYVVNVFEKDGIHEIHLSNKEPIIEVEDEYAKYDELSVNLEEFSLPKIYVDDGVLYRERSMQDIQYTFSEFNLNSNGALAG